MQLPLGETLFFTGDDYLSSLGADADCAPEVVSAPDGATATWVSCGLEELVQALLAACLCPVPREVVTDRHGDFKDLAVAHGRVILCSGSQGNQKAHRVR